MDNVTNYYALVNDIDASSTTYANSVVGTFTADSVFTGLGHTISNFTLTYDTTSSEANNLGLFGNVIDSTLRDLTISNANVDVLGDIKILSGGNIGILAGQAQGVIKNAHTSGVVRGQENIGGLVGAASNMTVSYSSSSAEVTGREVVGGLIGAASNFKGSYLTTSGEVNTLKDRAGGLIGELNSGTLDQVSTTGNVSGFHVIGGLVGAFIDNVGTSSVISNAVAEGDIIGGNYLGGLIGQTQ
jgi:hypothetical protein